MNLVEGKSIEIETKNGFHQGFSFAETFVIPAAAESVRVINGSAGEVILVFASVK